MRILFVIYDNGSHVNFFPLGPAYLTSVLEAAGVEVEFYHQDIHHWPEEHLTAHLDANRYDVVGLGFIAGYYQYRKFKAISAAINASKQRPFYLLGGHGPTPEAEFFLRKGQADAVIMGEGELTIVDFMDALANRRPLSEVPGLAWRDGDEVHINQPRPLIQDVDTIPMPAYHRFPMEVYRLRRGIKASLTDLSMAMLSGRGCTFRCNFCYRMDKGFRPRSSESIVEEIAFLKERYGITFITFGDELLMSSKQRTLDLCEAFIKAKLNIHWVCNGRLNYAEPHVLKCMKEAGCVFISYGIECMDDVILKRMHKGLTVKQIIRGIENTLAEDISPGFNVIFGNLGENRETLNNGVEFLLRYDDGAELRNIRPVTPYPGCELYQIAKERGEIKDCEDFYENKHTNSDLMTVNFTELTDDEFYEALCEANLRLLESHFHKKYEAYADITRQLYLERDASFRGYRHR